MKKPILMLLLSLTSVVLFSQTLYFKLVDDETNAEFNPDQIVFEQTEINNILHGKIVRSVLDKPLKSKSKYAKRLNLTYQINIDSVDEHELDVIENSLSNSPLIEYAIIDSGTNVPLTCPTNDPADSPSNLSRHDITCVQEAHCITTGDPEIIIASRDFGYIQNHPELVGQVVYAEPGAYNGDCHGTQTSTTSAGATNNGFGLSSSGYNCSLALYRVGDGTNGDLIDMCERGIRISHHSYATSSGNFLPFIQDGISLAAERGHIFVASAGNGNNGSNCGSSTSLCYPAAYDNAISVSSVTANLCLQAGNFHHNYNNTVDVLAQGFAIVTASCSGGQVATDVGTSYAAPHVAGIIGLMLSVNPCLNHDDVLYILQTTGQDVTNVCNNSSYYPNGAPPVPCAESAVLAAQNYIGPDIVITEDTEWDKKYVSGNVIISAGVTLTITGEVSFNTNSKVIVKKNANLVLDEGILTACNEQWIGVVVEGDGSSGNQLEAGKVTMVNKSKIEYAKDAVSMNPTHLGWPAVQSHYGGLIEAEDSEFSNCQRAVEFMRFGTGFREDDSFFKNCTFKNIEDWAVSIWANNNVTFEDCIFGSIGKSGIYVYDSEVIVQDNCKFFDQPTGIDLITTMPIPFGSRIGNPVLRQNWISSDEYGIYGQSQGYIRPVFISNNFITGVRKSSIHLDGDCNFQIWDNVLNLGERGVECFSTGSGSTNPVRNNHIISMQYGSEATYNNKGVYYEENCFENSSTADIHVKSGDISTAHGDEEFASGNCFSGGVPELDNSGNDVIALYIWEFEPANTCYYPTEIISNPSLYGVSIEDSINQKTGDKCEGDPEDPEDPQEPNPRDPFFANLENSSASNDEKIETAISYFSSQNKFEDKIFAFGFMLSSNQIERSRDYINSLVTENEAQENFILAQNINIDYMENIEGYSISSYDKNLLYTIGLGIDPLDGYARSIHEVITGERIEMTLPSDENLEFRLSNQEDLEVIYTISPNPAQKGRVNVLIENKAIEDEHVIKVTNLHGISVFDTKMRDSKYAINTSSYQNGIYFICIFNRKNELVFLEKLLLID